jgi:tetratricopeptide (TPR) repeat protein
MTALRYQPNYVEARLNLGTIYMDQGRLRDAEEEFQRALSLSPNHAEALERMGVLKVQQGDYNGALPYLERSLALNSRNSTAHYAMGVARTERGELEAALESLQTALYQYPNSAPVYYQMGVVYQRQGNGGAAVNALKKAISIKPEFRPASMALAEHYRQRGDWSPCLEVLKNLLESYPEDSSLRLRVADLSLQNRQPEIATRYYRELLEENPQDVDAKRGLALSERRIAQEQLAENTLAGKVAARQTLASAARLEPSDLETRLQQAKLSTTLAARSRGTNGESPAVLQGPALTPADSLTRGEVLVANRQYGAANQAFTVAILGFNTPEETRTLGELFLTLGLPNQAETAYQKVLTQAPDDPVATQGLAAVQNARRQARGLLLEAQLNQKEGSPFRAIQLAEEALKRDQTNLEAHLLLGQLYERVKRSDLALEHYQAYLTLSPPAPEARRVQEKVRRLQANRS